MVNVTTNNNSFQTIERSEYYQRIKERVSQRNILPSAIKARNIGENIVLVGGLSSASASTSNGNAYTCRTIITNTVGSPIMTEKYIALYLGAVSSATNLVTGSVSRTSYSLFGPIYDYEYWNSTLELVKYKSIITIAVYNISAGSVTLTFTTRDKYFAAGSEPTA